MALLAYYVLVLGIELSLATHPYLSPKFKTVARYVAAAAAAAACSAILLMPFREPSLPSVDISSVGQRPSNDFRSPEDDLKLWQFLTVSWMAPLISIGRRRQLHEQDVWLLGFDFQHNRLHEKFRRLRGSVLSRLLRANGIDVFIISTISIVQMLCGRVTQFLHRHSDPDHFIRLFNPRITAATITGDERPVPTQTCPNDLCLSVFCFETCGCSVPSAALVVWKTLL